MMNRKTKKVTIVNMGYVSNILDIPIFLFNMFNDEFILPVTQPFRIVAAFLLTAFRARKTYKILKISPSPLKGIMKKQAEFIGDVEYRFVYSMPFLECGSVNVVPMYNFYSHTTHGKIFKKSRIVKPPFCIYNEFFNLVEFRIANFLKVFKRDGTAIILSAHSIPKMHAKKDTYKEDLRAFEKYLRKRFKGVGVFLSFQSKIGPVKWIEPTTNDTMKKISKYYENLIIFPISFTAENTETVYEMDVIYKKLAFGLGFKMFKRINCFNDDSDFIRFLSKVVLS